MIIRIVKLSDGTEIIGGTTVSYGVMTINNPLVVTNDKTNRSMYMSDPLILSWSGDICVSMDQVLYSYVPSDPVIDYYKEAYLYQRNPETICERFEAIQSSVSAMRETNTKTDTIN